MIDAIAAKNKVTFDVSGISSQDREEFEKYKAERFVGFGKHQKEFTPEQFTELQKLVNELLKSGEIWIADVVRAGLRPGDIKKKARGLLSGYNIQRAEKEKLMRNPATRRETLVWTRRGTDPIAFEEGCEPCKDPD